MQHVEVIDRLNKMFPNMTGHMKIWFPNGKNSIRVRRGDNKEFIFTYNNDEDWRLETTSSFLNNMKGAK